MAGRKSGTDGKEEGGPTHAADAEKQKKNQKMEKDQVAARSAPRAPAQAGKYDVTASKSFFVFIYAGNKRKNIVR